MLLLRDFFVIMHIYHNSSCIITFQYLNSLTMVLFSGEKMTYLGIFASLLKYLKLIKIILHWDIFCVSIVFFFHHCLILSISWCWQMRNVIWKQTMLVDGRCLNRKQFVWEISLGTKCLQFLFFNISMNAVLG